MRNCLAGAVLVLWMCLHVTVASGAQNRLIPVTVDPRVELVSIVFRLAGNRAYNQCQIPSYSADIDAHFAAYAEHPAVKMARKICQEKGIGFDSPMSFAVYLEEGFSFRSRLAWNPVPKEFGERWTTELLTEFCEKIRAFAKDSRFEEFFKRHMELYAGPCNKLEMLLATKADLSWFSRFFGFAAPVSFRVILGMNNGGGCYGPTFIDGDRFECYSILGIQNTGVEGMPEIPEGALPLVVHEFGHSFSNPVVERYLAEMASSAQYLFEYEKPLLNRQGYGKWSAILLESVLRACVIRYFKDHWDARTVVQELRDNHEGGFVWIEDLVRLLGQYAKDRRTYPTFEAFMPEIVRLFDAWVPKMAELERNRPHVVEMVPANGATDVPPTTNEIRVTFDKPMSPEFAWCQRGQNFPEDGNGKPSWTMDRKTCIWPISLKPDRGYRFSLNGLRKNGFKSADGVALVPVECKFSTGLTHEQEALRPVVVSSVPENGDPAVDPSLAAVRVTFSSAMGNDAVWGSPKGYEDPAIPDGSEGDWQDGQRSYVIPVRLKPGIAYRLILNPEGMKAFRNKDGIPLKEYSLCFTTKAMP